MDWNDLNPLNWFAPPQGWPDYDLQVKKLRRRDPAFDQRMKTGEAALNTVATPFDVAGSVGQGVGQGMVTGTHFLAGLPGVDASGAVPGGQGIPRPEPERSPYITPIPTSSDIHRMAMKESAGNTASAFSDAWNRLLNPTQKAESLQKRYAEQGHGPLYQIASGVAGDTALGMGVAKGLQGLGVGVPRPGSPFGPEARVRPGLKEYAATPPQFLPMRTVPESQLVIPRRAAVTAQGVPVSPVSRSIVPGVPSAPNVIVKPPLHHSLQDLVDTGELSSEIADVVARAEPREAAIAYLNYVDYLDQVNNQPLHPYVFDTEAWRTDPMFHVMAERTGRVPVPVRVRGPLEDKGVYSGGINLSFRPDMNIIHADVLRKIKAGNPRPFRPTMQHENLHGIQSLSNEFLGGDVVMNLGPDDVPAQLHSSFPGKFRQAGFFDYYGSPLGSNNVFGRPIKAEVYRSLLDELPTNEPVAAGVTRWYELPEVNKPLDDWLFNPTAKRRAEAEMAGRLAFERGFPGNPARDHNYPRYPRLTEDEARMAVKVIMDDLEGKNKHIVREQAKSFGIKLSEYLAALTAALGLSDKEPPLP